MARKKKSASKKKERPNLTREAILAASMELADQDGPEALTMRRLAEKLGIEAMSLYYHFAGKEAILDGMVDGVFAEISREWNATADQSDWKPAMRRRALGVRLVLLRHPWAIGLLDSRENPGSATLAHHDAVIGCLRRAGFSIALTAHAFAALDSYIYGFVLQELSLPFQSTDEMADVADTILERMPADIYPHLSEMTHHTLRTGYSFANEFEFGLHLILDGFEKLLKQDPA